MLRVAAGLRQGVFADQIGITQAYLSALEADKRKPSVELVERIAKLLGTPPESLLALMVEAHDVPSRYEEVIGKLRELHVLLLQLQAESLADEGT